MAAEPRLSLILRNCALYDGTGAPPRTADIGIESGMIAVIADRIDPSRADASHDLRGLAVSPGFIDVHGHSEFSLLAAPEAEGKLLQGITTEISGNCGLSAGPLMADAARQREPDLVEYGITHRWSTLAEYFTLLEAARPAINFATLVGHGNLRASVMGYTSRPEPARHEMERMKALLADAIAHGAIGMSTGLIYPPGIYSTSHEIHELALHGVSIMGSSFVYASHMRSEGDGLLEAIAETIAVGRASGCRVHISHIKTSGRANWQKFADAVRIMGEARAGGIEVTCDRYPYCASSTDLDAILPSYMFEGGSASELDRLMSPGIADELRGTGLLKEGESWRSIVVSSVHTDDARWMEGLSVDAIAGRMGCDPVEAVVRVLVSQRLRVGAVFHLMSEENLKGFLSLPYAMLGTDSTSRNYSGPTAMGKPHPRGFGSFPRFLSRYAGELRDAEGRDPLSHAIYKSTMLPAITFGIARRGQVREGFHADLVAFDPARIEDRATYEAPYTKPAGIAHVLVNGGLAVRDGEITGARHGSALRGFGR